MLKASYWSFENFFTKYSLIRNQFFRMLHQLKSIPFCAPPRLHLGPFTLKISKPVVSFLHEIYMGVQKQLEFFYGYTRKLTIYGTDLLKTTMLERFSIECRTTKTKVITSANLNKGHKYHKEPMGTQSKY